MNILLNGLNLTSNITGFRTTQGGVIVNTDLLAVDLPGAPLRYLYSGWQSWSLTAWVDTDHPILPLRPKNQQSRIADPLHVNDPRPNGSWYGMVELSGDLVLFMGALELETHVVLENGTLKGLSKIGKVDWFLAYGNETNIMSRYAELLSERLGCSSPKKSPRVWCSWYSLYTEIHEQQLLKILTDLGLLGSAQCLPFEVFQIDDGWQQGIGDWEANEKFPSGMENLASSIKASGRIAGLWLTPLLVVPSSSIFREHPDWLVQNEKGALVSAGFNWGEPLYTLDTTHPAVLDWLAKLMKKVRSWGFDYLKLDFLYAGALPGQRYVDMPRELAYRNGLKIIRQALGEAYLLACGAPILPTLGLCDGLRIGPDVAGTWSAWRDDQLLRNYSIPGGRNALRTTFNRLWLQPLVNIDPDVVFFCTRQNNLTNEQKQILQDMAYICKFKATSDIPAWLTETEKSGLREFLVHQPEIQKLGQTTYLIDDREVDFTPYIGMPSLPNAFDNLAGGVIGELARVPFVMKSLEILEKYSLKRTLKHNPV